MGKKRLTGMTLSVNDSLSKLLQLNAQAGGGVSPKMSNLMVWSARPATVIVGIFPPDAVGVGLSVVFTSSAVVVVDADDCG